MAGPAQAGLFIYAKDVARLADFYEAVLGMSRAFATEELIVVQSPDIQLVVHAMPVQVAATVTITAPPQRRDTALKFFFTVPSIAAARSSAATLGGEVIDEQWEGPGFRVCNACDPEGNVFQVRESVA